MRGELDTAEARLKQLYTKQVCRGRIFGSGVCVFSAPTGVCMGRVFEPGWLPGGGGTCPHCVNTPLAVHEAGSRPSGRGTCPHCVNTPLAVHEAGLWPSGRGICPCCVNAPPPSRYATQGRSQTFATQKDRDAFLKQEVGENEGGGGAVGWGTG